MLENCERASQEQLAAVALDQEGDTIYAVDRVGEAVLIEFFEREVAPLGTLVLIAEGLPSGRLVLPRGASEWDAQWRIIVDPIDGTRELMYQKRSAWILTGVAPNLGPNTSLADIELAVQTEIPTLKQHLCDTLWAVRNEGACAERTNRLTGEVAPLEPRPSRAQTIAHGFAMLARFFPGARDELAAIDDEIICAALGPGRRGKAVCFEDQYLSTGGQLYELMAGHYRFVADLRPLMESLLAKRGRRLGLCCHPYDISTELIARELGVIITDERGDQIDSPLDVETEIAWAGYANTSIREEVEPLLQKALRDRGLG